MRPHRPSLLALLVLFLHCGTPLEADTPDRDPEALDQAAASLGSGSFREREAATKLLWQYADQAAEQLAAALTSSDSEIRARAERISEAYRLGILPDTPLDVARRIYEFHDGNLRKKREILNELLASDDLGTAFRLLRSIDNKAIRNDLAQGLAQRVRAQLLPYLVEKDWDRAEQLLDRAAVTDAGMRDFAAFSSFLGRTKEVLVNRAPGKSLQVWLHRATGAMDDALAAAGDDVELLRNVRCASGDALAFCDSELAEAGASPTQSARNKAFKARFTDNREAFTEAVEELVQIARVADDYNKREAINALLLNGVVTPILPHLPKVAAKAGYDVQSYRGLYREALAELGIRGETSPFPEWVEASCAKLQQNADDEAFKALRKLATQLAEMGDEDEAEKLFGKLYELCEGSAERQYEIIFHEIQNGLRESAKKHMRERAESLSIQEIRSTYLASSAIEQWFDFLVVEEKEAKPRIETLFQAWDLVDVREGDPRPTGIDALLDKAYENSRTLDARSRPQYLQNLYLTAKNHGSNDRAARYLGDLITATAADSWRAELASLMMEEQNWLEAAEIYELLWDNHLTAFADSPNTPQASNQGDPPQTLFTSYLYRAGRAYEMAGEGEKGEEMIQSAQVLCLGDLGAHYDLATAMVQAGDEARAQKQWKLIARLSQPDEPLGTWGFYHLVQTLHKSDLALALRYQERLMVARHLLSLRPDLLYTFNIRMQSLWCQWTAKLLLREGKADEGLAAVEQFWQLTPGNASIGEELLPLLEDVGKAAEARDYYEKTRALSQEACELFPNSAMAHNNLAWLDARSRRQLDQAFKHATLANDLQPNTAAYIDTLAEVYFAQGDRAKALELSDQAIKLLPEDEELIGQRERFEKAPLPVKRPALD